MRSAMASTVLLAAAAAGCQGGGRIPAAAVSASPKEVVASYGQVVTVRFESERAYGWFQKALYWRGQVDAAYAPSAMTEAKRMGYLLSVDNIAEYRDDADLFISEAEARKAFEIEFQAARAAQRAELRISDPAPASEAVRVPR